MRRGEARGARNDADVREAGLRLLIAIGKLLDDPHNVVIVDPPRIVQLLLTTTELDCYFVVEPGEASSPKV